MAMLGRKEGENAPTSAKHCRARQFRLLNHYLLNATKQMLFVSKFDDELNPYDGIL